MNDLLFEKDLKMTNCGDVETVDGFDAVNQSIVLRLNTRYGSNMFHPEYGNRLYDILSQNMSEQWIEKATTYVKECVEQDERILVNDIKVITEPSKRKVRFYITYIFYDVDEEQSLEWSEDVG